MRPIAWMLLAIAVTSQASNARKTEIIETEATAFAEAARVWGLSDQEWRKYQQVMSDQRGIWSPGLDPITALGVSADTAAERPSSRRARRRSDQTRCRSKDRETRATKYAPSG